MRPFRLSLWCCIVLLAGASQAHAAWDNVFQVTCFGCWKKQPATANYYAPPPSCQPACQPSCQPACQPACQTAYQLRSYYQPVTTYRTSCYYEPVTSYRTSYYYEPVTSYRYSYYYDPCSCSYQAKACPTTSYQLKAQTCPVTSYLQRTQLVPETSYKQSYYYEPVTTCCNTTTGAPIYPQGTQPPPSVNEGRGTPPSVSEGRGQLPPGNEQSRKTGVSDFQPRYLPPVPNTTPYRQPELQTPVPVQQSSPKNASPPSSVRLDRIVLVDEPNVEGQVVLRDKNPQVGARVLFVSADQLGEKQTVTADANGQFKVNLSTGGWLVYVHDEKGNPVYKEKVEVKDNQPNRMVLTSR